MKQDTVKRLVAMFESMAPADVQRLHQWYTEDAWFKDPFNDVRGLREVQRIYAHMFEALEAPRFKVVSQVVQGDECVLLWEFHFRRRARGAAAMVVRGASHLLLSVDGRIAVHRDYWDPAEEVYEKVPVLGSLMRALKKRLSAA